jgi:hypothetical protein
MLIAFAASNKLISWSAQQFGRLIPNAAAFAAKPLREKLKDIKGIWALCVQVFLDQFVHHPLLYFPVFYGTRELVMADKPDLMRCINL